MRWLATNLALFVAVEAVYVALLGRLLPAPTEIAATVLAVAALLTIPFLPVYLGAVAALPRTWTRRRRRVAAVVASPLLLAIFIIRSDARREAERRGGRPAGSGLFVFETGCAAQAR